MDEILFPTTKSSTMPSGDEVVMNFFQSTPTKRKRSDSDSSEGAGSAEETKDQKTDEILFPTNKTTIKTESDEVVMKFFETSDDIIKKERRGSLSSESGAGGDAASEDSIDKTPDNENDGILGSGENADEESFAQKQKTKRELEAEEREKMQVLVSNFTEDQLDRYEMYRRAAFPKAAVKRLMQTITGCSVSQNVVIAMSGIAKVFVGEIVEEALDVMEQSGETGALQPKYLREAVRRLRRSGRMPIGRFQRPFFRLN